VRGIVSGWAQRCNPKRALALGFKPDASFDEIIRIYQQDEMGK
jgi:nucleoside-diphosphate-sugar epimerase